MIVVNFDGGCGPVNPGGTAVWGYVITFENGKKKKCFGLVGKGEGMTCNVAEYQGLINALEYLYNSGHTKKVIKILGDSKLVIYMISERWGKGKPHKDSPHLFLLLKKAKNLRRLSLDNR